MGIQTGIDNIDDTIDPIDAIDVEGYLYRAATEGTPTMPTATLIRLLRTCHDNPDTWLKHRLRQAM